MDNIQSETKFVWKLLLSILLIPVTFVLIILRKKSLSDLLQPFREAYNFAVEPRLTIFIIFVNVAAYGTSLFLSPEIIESLVLTPSDIFELKVHTLITSGFLHANPIHLLGNMIGIFIFGRVVERQLGIQKTAVVYFSAMITGGLLTSFIHYYLIGDNVGGIGASGALMGLIATAILLDPLYLTYEFLVPIPIMMLGWLALYADITGIINPTEDGIGHFAHIGGFISVALIVFLFHSKDRDRMRKGLMINLISMGIAGMVLLYLSMR